MSDFHTHKMPFLGGSVSTSPAGTFSGRDGKVVKLPDRIVLAVEGKKYSLTYAALKACHDFYDWAPAKDSLEWLAAKEADEQETGDGGS